MPHNHFNIRGELLWCKKCETEWFIAEFNNWTSGDLMIDRFIKNTQTTVSNELKYLEWIPYERLKDVEEINKGGFGTVYSAIWIDGPKWKPSLYFRRLVRNGPWKVALKSIKNSGKVPREFLRELNAHYKCTAIVNHVPHCFGITKPPEEDSDYIIVMEYAHEGDLRTYLSKFEGQPSWPLRNLVLQHIAKGLKTVFDAGILHSDLHPGNILVFKDCENKLYIAIGDLGLCQNLNDSDEDIQKGLFGVMPYIAPELLRGSAGSKATTIYSFGMIAYEIASLEKPFTNQNHDAHLALGICDGNRPQIPNDTPDYWRDLITRCWDSKPVNRPSITEIIDIIKEWPILEQEIFTNSENPQQPLKQSQQLINHSKPVEDSRYTSRYLPEVNTVYITREYDIDTAANS